MGEIAAACSKKAQVFRLSMPGRSANPRAPALLRRSSPGLLRPPKAERHRTRTPSEARRAGT
eukprot:6994350-Alexandrium_andersonii.AAC.1